MFGHHICRDHVTWYFAMQLAEGKAELTTIKCQFLLVIRHADTILPASSLKVAFGEISTLLESCNTLLLHT